MGQEGMGEEGEARLEAGETSGRLEQRTHLALVLTCFLLTCLPVLQYNAVRCVFCTVLGLLLGSIYYRVGLQLALEVRAS